MSTPTPPNGMVSNTELILRHILGEDVTPLPPNSRVEFYLIQVEEYIERLATGATRPIGETTTPLTDGATTNPIVIDGESYTAQINDLVFYGNKEFLFTANGWREVGDITNLNADMIDDVNTTKKFTNASEKQTWNGKQDSTLATWTPGSATTHSTPAVGDTITEALQKIDNNQRNDENNISLINHAANTSLYFSETPPTGTITVGSYWISTDGVKIYGDTGNIFDGTVVQGSFDPSTGGDAESTNRVRTTFMTNPLTAGLYVVSVVGADDVIMYVYDESKQFESALSIKTWQSLPYTFYLSGTYYIRFGLRNNDNTDIIPSDIISITLIKKNTWH